jgi:hypothetical protein
MQTKTNLLAAGMALATVVTGFAQSLSTVQFASASYSVNEGAGSVIVTVQRIGEPGLGAYVEYATHDESAENGTDYIEQNGYLWFNGDTNLTITIPIVDDAVAESDETFSITLFNPDPFNTELGSVTNAIVTVLDDDRRVEFSPATYTVDEAAGLAVITVKGKSYPGQGFSVDYFTSGCSATAGMDYVPQSGTLNFAAGETEKRIVISILEDALVEGDETVNLSLSHPVGVPLGPQSNAVLVIRDNDQANALDVELTPQRVGIWSPPRDGVSHVAVAGNYAYVMGADGLQVLDVSNPVSPRLVGQAAGGSGDLAILCDRAYAAAGWDGMAVFDISQPQNPQRVSAFATALPTTAVAVQGNRAYLTFRFCDFGSCEAGLDIVDISALANPKRLGTISMPNAGNGVSDVAVSGGYAYVANDYGGLIVIDVGNPSDPRVVQGRAWDVCWRIVVVGHYAYVLGYDSSRDNNFGVLDISDPANPLPLAACKTSIGVPVDLSVIEGAACVAGAGGLELFDIRDPANPRRATLYPTDGGVLDLAVSGSLAFVAETTGLEIIDLNPLAFLPASIKRLADGDVTVTLTTRLGQSYTLQASTNLVDWETLETLTASDTRLNFIDTNAPSFSRRFYRAVAQ